MKKFTSAIIVFIIVVSISIFIILSDMPKSSTAEMMKRAFEATGAKIVTSELYLRADVQADNLANLFERQQLIYDIITAAGGDTSSATPAISSIETDISFGNKTDYIINDNMVMHISLIKEKTEKCDTAAMSNNDKKADTSGKADDLQKADNRLKQENNAMLEEKYSLSISITDTAQQPKMDFLVKKMTSALQRYNIDPTINLNLTGSLEGHLNDSELEHICEKVFERADANKVEGMRDHGLISVSAFSPSISDSIRVNGKRVNLNVAVRYNSYEGKTYVWLGTPVITTEY